MNHFWYKFWMQWNRGICALGLVSVFGIASGCKHKRPEPHNDSALSASNRIDSDEKGSVPRDPPLQPKTAFSGGEDLVAQLNAPLSGSVVNTICPSASAIYFGVSGDPDFLEGYVGQLPRDLTSCLWGTVGKNRDDAKKDGLIGMVFGFQEEISVGLGYAVGGEFLALKDPNSNDMLFGVFGYRGYDFGIGLPGVSAVQGFVLGNCGAYPLDLYTGWFRTISGLANNNSFGKTSWWDWADSGCNSWTITRGTTTPVLGVSRTFYSKHGHFIRIRGDYFAPTIEKLRGR